MFDLEDFVASCQRLAAAPDGAGQVLELMRAAVRDPEGLKQAVTPGASGADILNAPLFRASDLVVLNATLYPHLTSPPHDHCMWAVIGIYEGQESNTFYRRAGERLEEVSRREVRAGEAILLGPDVIHAIANPLPSRTLGLHVYGGDLAAATHRRMWNPYSGEELPYDNAQFFAWCAELASARRAR